MTSAILEILASSNLPNSYGTSILSGLLPAITTVIGFVVTICVWISNIKVRRADYIRDMLEKIHNDRTVQDVVYIMQYNDKWYTTAFYDDHEFETKMDAALSFFSYICYLRNKRIITKDEFGLFHSMICHIAKNNSTLRYFYNLRHYSEIYSSKFAKAPKKHIKYYTFMNLFTFRYLFEYMVKNNYVDKKLFSKDYNALTEQEKIDNPHLYQVLKTGIKE